MSRVVILAGRQMVADRVRRELGMMKNTKIATTDAPPSTYMHWFTRDTVMFIEEDTVTMGRYYREWVEEIKHRPCQAFTISCDKLLGIERR